MRSKRRQFGVLAIVATLLAVSSCGGSAGTVKATFGAPVGTIVTIEVSPLGSVLAGANRSAFYVMVGEADGRVACSAACNEVWPYVPLAADGARPLAGPGVRASLLGVSTVRGGARAVTYGGYLLHTYIGDGAQGDTAGQGIQGEWFVVSPAGVPVRQPGTGGG